VARLPPSPIVAAALDAMLAPCIAVAMHLGVRGVRGGRRDAEAAERAATEGEAGDESFDRHGDLLLRSASRECSARAIAKRANRLARWLSHMQRRPIALRIPQTGHRASGELQRRRKPERKRLRLRLRLKMPPPCRTQSAITPTVRSASSR
jgi:hypothetical protein